MREKILEHLEKYGTITTWEAIQKYHCTRISEYIRQLREDNYNIESVRKNVTRTDGIKTWIVVYTLIKDKEKENEE